MLGTLPIEWRFALWALHPTSPLTYRVSLHLQSVPTASPLTGCTRLSRSTRTLRPHASLLHKAAFQKVRGSRCAEAPLGAPHRCAPSRVSKTGLMQSGLRWVRSHSRRRSPGRGYTPYAPPSARPCGVPAPWHQSGATRFVLVSGLRPVMLCLPRPPWASPLRGIGLRGLPVRPQGAPSAHA